MRTQSNKLRMLVGLRGKEDRKKLAETVKALDQNDIGSPTGHPWVFFQVAELVWRHRLE